MTNEINQSQAQELGPKKRVLFVITQSELGGAQRFLCEFVSCLDSKKYELLVASGASGNGELLDEIRGLDILSRSLKFLKRDIDIINDWKAVFEIRKLLLDYKPDVLFLNSSKAGFIGSLATIFPSKISPKIKVIYRIGGWTFNDPWPRWKKWLWIMLEKKSASWKDIIIVNNAHDFQQAKQLRIIPRQKVVLVHNGLDPYKMNFLPTEEARLKLFEKVVEHSGKIFPASGERGSTNKVGRQTKIIIGTIANFYPSKGLESLIASAEYFKNNDDIAFFVIGDGLERPKLERLIREKGLEKKMFLLGYISNARTYLPAFDIFILPSLKEGFPWSLIEAMAARLPVIATGVGAVQEIIEDGKNGFIVEPGKPEQIVRRIREILTSNHLQKELAIQAHQAVLFKFDMEKMIKRIESLL